MSSGAHSHGPGGGVPLQAVLALVLAGGEVYLAVTAMWLFCLLNGLAVAGGSVLAVRAGYERWRKFGAARRDRLTCGTATVWEKRRKLSARAVTRTSLGVPREHAASLLGTSGGQQVMVPRLAAKMLLAPPRTWKTALMAQWAATAPGSLVATSVRGDMWEHTAQRRRHGQVLVLDADGDTGIGTDFAWDPVAGCGNPQTARRRAGDFVSASPRSPDGRDVFHEAEGVEYLAYLFHGAAVTGAPMAELHGWAGDPLCGGPQKALRHEDAWPGWALGLDALLDRPDHSGLKRTAQAALGWMLDPVLSAVVHPAPGKGFSPRRFIHEGTGSLYLTGMGREFGSFAPLFAAIVAETVAAVRHVAERSPGRRLPRLATLALDELMTISPVPVWQWAPLVQGWGAELIAGIQSPSQMTARWGEHNAKTFRAACPVKLIGGGFDDPADLKALSELCGTDPATDRPVYSPQAIAQLRPWHGLAFIRGARPVEVKVRPVWQSRGYTPAVARQHQPELEARPGSPDLTGQSRVPELEAMLWAGRRELRSRCGRTSGRWRNCSGRIGMRSSPRLAGSGRRLAPMTT